MKRGLTLFILVSIVRIFILYSDSIVIKVVAKDTSEGLPFSIVRIPNVGSKNTDCNGILKINWENSAGKEMMVSSFGYDDHMLKLPMSPLDTISVELVSSPTLLKEIVIKPLKKDKDITKGKVRANLGFFNTGYFNVNPDHDIDSITGRLFEYSIGIPIEAKRGKINYLRSFGINVVPCDSMVEEMTFILNIYDVTGHDLIDTLSAPKLANPPIVVKYRADQVDRKKKEFKYVLPEPIVLPQEAVIMVDGTWYDDQGNSFLRGKYFKIRFSRIAVDYMEGNPYKRRFQSDFLGLKDPSPYFFEYTQYSLPDDN